MMYKNILAKFFEDACHPSLVIFRDGGKQLSLPSAGDPYYTVDANLEEEEFEQIKKDFPNIQILYR